MTSLLPIFGCGSGCLGTKIEAISFRRSSLDLNIGETYTVTGSLISFEPAITKQKAYTLSSSDEAVVIIGRRSSFTAVGSGSATVTATSNYNAAVTASITVNVSYAVPTRLDIEMQGSRVRYSDDMKSLVLSVTADVELDPAYKFDWEIGTGVYRGIGAVKNFNSADVGDYPVKVTIPGLDISGSSYIKVFSSRLKSAGASFVGETVQENRYTPVEVTALWTANDKNKDPKPFIDWYVDGEKYLSDEEKFAFTPSGAGVYEIELRINDEPVPIAGKDKLTVTAKGSVTPGSVRYRFDNIYPKVMIEWESPPAPKMNFGLKIVNLTTGKVDETLTTTNASARPYFDGCSFSAGSFLDLVENEYEIYVRSLGDGDTYTPSDYSMPVRTSKIEAKAIPYLEKKALGDTLDYYASDDDDFLRLMSYHFAFRGGGDIDYKVYMGYSSKYDVNELVSHAFDYASTVGSFNLKESGETSKGSICRVRIGCYNTVVPEKYGSSTSEELGALEPHTAKNSDRKLSHVFEIDKVERAVEVETSEELFRSVEYGVRPIPKQDSQASRLYAYARRLLISIISDDMTDVEKVHAIYDWIMWNVRYDYEAAGTSNAVESSKYVAYYIDGVLRDNNAFAVCDGMAKTLSLLCNMEGIPAYRVSGRAGKSVADMNFADAAKTKQNWAGHAWNKVYVEGEWYVVDPTWGDTRTTIRSRSYELALHRWLLVSDEDIADTHEYSHTVNNPETAKTSYNIYEKTTLAYEKDSESLFADCYIDTTGENLRKELSDILDALVYAARQRTSYGQLSARYNTFTIGNRTMSRSYYGVEIGYAQGSKNELLAAVTSSAGYYASGEKVPSANNIIDAVLRSYGYKSDDYMLLRCTDSVIIMLEPIMV